MMAGVLVPPSYREFYREAQSRSQVQEEEVNCSSRLEPSLYPLSGKLLAPDEGGGPPLSENQIITELLYIPASLRLSVTFPTTSSMAVTMPR